MRFKFKIKGKIKDLCGVLVDLIEVCCNEDWKGDVLSVIFWFYFVV